jgi:hypothetical protein
MTQFLYIVGRGRSGTTLLSKILNAHSEISVAPEGVFMMNLYYKYKDVEEWTPALLKNFIQDIFRENRITNLWGIEAKGLEEHLLRLVGHRSYGEICAEVYRYFSNCEGKRDARVLIDKNPHYSLFVNQLGEILPAAKFIYIVRDPRDTVLSYQQKKFDMFSVPGLAYRWEKYNEIILKHRGRFPDRYFTLRYEDLVSDPEPELEKLCQFIGIDYTKGFLDFYKDEDENRPEWFRSSFEGIRRPLDRDNAYKWKTEMSPADIRAAQKAAFPLMKYFGYEIREGKVGFYSMLDIYFGIFRAAILTFLEQILYHKFPLSFRTYVLNLHRRVTGTR